MEYISDNLDYHYICDLIHTELHNKWTISDIEHYLQHSHGDGRRFALQMDYSYILRIFGLPTNYGLVYSALAYFGSPRIYGLAYSALAHVLAQIA